MKHIFILFSSWILLISSSCGETTNSPDKPLGNDDLLKDVPFIFRAGENGYAAYRAPAVVVSKEGTVLAFAEGRVNNQQDEGDIDVVLKRSIDGGKTWGELQVLEDDGPNPCKNACPVVLESGRILYVWLWNESIPSEDDRTTRDVYVSYSDDDGLTWSESKNITSSVYHNDWGWYGTGPCHGIQLRDSLHKGRIIIPCRHQLLGSKTFSHIIYSDNQGETWEIGAIALREKTTESTVVELSNGDVMMNSRNAINGQNFRMKSISKDAGETFLSTEEEHNLIEPAGCQGSLLYHSVSPETGKGIILFSNPNHHSYRVLGTIKLSEDDGETWTARTYLYSKEYPAYSGYSDLALFPDGTVGVLYETGTHYDKSERYKGIAFKRIALNDIQ